MVLLGWIEVGALMPITKAVRSAHICDLPDPARLASLGYLPETEWTCDECASVYVLVTEGMAGMSWKLQEPISEPEEPETPTPPPGG